MIDGAHIHIQGRLAGAADCLEDRLRTCGARLHRRVSRAVTHTVVSHERLIAGTIRRIVGVALSEIAFMRCLGLAPLARGEGRAFTRDDIGRLSGLGDDVVARLLLADVLDPAEERFCFRDLASARQVARLLGEGVRLDAIVSVGVRLRRRGLRLSEARLEGASWGEIVLVAQDGMADVDGQFALPLADVAEDASLMHERALALEEAGDDFGAERLYRAACARDRASPDAAVDLGVFLAARGRLDEAREALIEARRRAPEDADILYDIARLHDLAGRPREAVAFYREAIGRAPDHVFAHHNIALVLMREGRCEEARPHWDAVALHARGEERARARRAALLCRLDAGLRLPE